MKRPILSCARLSVAALLFALVATHPILAQNGTQTAPPTTDSQTATDDDMAPANPGTDRAHQTTAQNIDEAWNILKISAADPKKPDVRSEAVTAIGTIQGSRIAHKLISDALTDSDLDVRTAGILAVGTLKDKGLYGQLHAMLDDKEPQIAYTAAVTLWKAGDKSGEDILMSIIDGDRKSDAGLIKGSERAGNKELHSPAKMAEFGAKQGVVMLFGPAGYGLTAWDYTHKHNGENPRVTAINLLEEERTPNARNSLLAALDDKDPQVRAAAAHALGDYRDKSTAVNLLTTFDDSKLSVRLTGAAAYIRTTGSTSGSLLHHTAATK